MTVLGNIIRHAFKRIRRFKINREFLIFVVFLVVSVVFWFLQTFKETTTATLTYKLSITGVPNNVILTSTLPKEITATVSGRGFSILEFLSKNDRQTLEIDYSSIQQEDGLLTIDNQVWRKVFGSFLSRSLRLVSVNPSLVQIYYSTGSHKYVPVIYAGKAQVDGQHVLCGIDINPMYVDIYAPENLFDTITAIYTERIDFKNLKDTTSVKMALVPPVGVKCIPDSVTTTIAVDLFTTKSLKLPIFCENIPQDKVLRTFPAKADITFRVSASIYSRITEDDFALVVDYASLKPGDKKCQLILRSIPDGISDVHISPQFVDYIIEQE
jgi:YbbR domain-containing protein